jgi:glutathione S-transferase
MLELYHHGSSVCAAKVRLVLAEKGLDWKGYYLDILKGDQFEPDYMKLNPKAVVPTLIHDGKVLTESTVICEYLDEVFPDRPLKPSDAYGRHRMRLWTKAVDEQVHPACAELTFSCTHRHTLARLTPTELERFLESTPVQSVKPGWKARKREIVTLGFAAPGIDQPFKLYDGYLQKMEDALKDQPWLAGDSFTLADIAMAPYVNRLDMLDMSELWTRRRPRVTDWFGRVKARASFQPAFMQWFPAQLANDMATFGAQSWPDVRRILAA